jgi:hypothetical protein
LSRSLSQPLEVPRGHVLDERTVGYDDDVPLRQLLGAVQEMCVRIDVEELVRLPQREGVVELGLLSDGDPEGLEALLARPVENLHRGVRACRRDDEVVLVILVEDSSDAIP